MTLRIDHVFVATSDAHELESALAEFGIAFTHGRVHKGQGTANAIALFENAFLEILRAENRDDLRSELVRPLGLDERIRWRETAACPFGLCFRPASTDEPLDWPFEVWQYRPAYAPGGIPIVTPPGRHQEPLVFIAFRPPTEEAARPLRKAVPLHRGAPRRLTCVKLCLTEPAEMSPGVGWFVEQGLFIVEKGSTYGLELEWDGGNQGRSHRFQVEPHIVLRW